MVLTNHRRMWAVWTPVWWFWCWHGGGASCLSTWVLCERRNMQRNTLAACSTTSTTYCASGSTTTSTRTRTAPAWRMWAPLDWPNVDFLSWLWVLKAIPFVSLSYRVLVFPSPTGRRQYQCCWVLVEVHNVPLAPTLMKPTGTWTETSWSCDYRDWEDSLYIRITSCLHL